MTPRIIPVLLLSHRRLVKTVRFKNGRYIGDPLNAIRIFNEKEVDELVVLDIGSSKNDTAPDYEIIKMFADECFMPLTYGGGIKTLDDAKKIFDIGIEKISVQSAALLNLDFLSAVSARYGQQSVVVSVDVKRNFLGVPKVYSSRSGKKINIPLNDYIKNIINAGAGEILLNAVDKDGLMSGYDLDLIKEVAELSSVPVVALGGAGCLTDFRKAVKVGASAVAAGSLFVYQGPRKAVLINYPKRQQLDFN